MVREAVSVRPRHRSLDSARILSAAIWSRARHANRSLRLCPRSCFRGMCAGPRPRPRSLGQAPRRRPRLLPGGREDHSPAAPADPGTAAVAAKPAGAPAPLTPPSTAECIPYVNPLTAEEIEAGWLSLFDGHTLFGWASNQSEVNWSVKDGTITADSGPIGLLNTTVPFADFEFR